MSYSEKTSSYTFGGNGFGIAQNGVNGASLQTSLYISDSGKPVFQSGQFTFGDKTHSIKDLNLFLQSGKKFIRLSAMSDDGLAITASGRLAASAGTDLIYTVNGKASEKNTDNGFSLIMTLKQDNPQEVGIAGVLPKDNTQNKPDSAKQDILILVRQSERVQWKNPYDFTVKIFDKKINTLIDFDQSSGYLNGVKISATITNPDGQIIKTSSGITQNLGLYRDSIIIPDNARIGTYTLNVTASGEKFNTTYEQFEFSVIPLGTSS